MEPAPSATRAMADPEAFHHVAGSGFKSGSLGRRKPHALQVAPVYPPGSDWKTSAVINTLSTKKALRSMFRPLSATKFLVPHFGQSVIQTPPAMI